MTTPTRNDIEITKGVLRELYEQVKAMDIKSKPEVCNEISRVLSMVEWIEPQPEPSLQEQVFGIVTKHVDAHRALVAQRRRES